MANMSSKDTTIRVAIVQPSLAKYRIPVFQELARRPGLDLTVYYGTRSNLKNVPAEGFKAVETPMWIGRVLGSQLFFHGAQWNCARREVADVLVLNWTPRYINQVAALLRAKWQGVPTVLWGHGFSRRDRALFRLGRWLTGQLGTRLMFYDSHTASEYQNRGWNAERLYVAPNAIEHTAIEAARAKWLSEPERLEEFRRQHNLYWGQTLLYLSRLLPENRVDLLIRSLPRVLEELPHIKAVIIGNGDEERARLEGLAAELGVQDHTLFHDGIYNEEELAPWMLSSNAFCYPESVGLSILHAFWYGLPIVTSELRSCHNPEIVAMKEGENGLTFQHRSPDSLAKTIIEMLSDRERLERRSESARSTVENCYTIERMVDGMEKAIRSAHQAK